MSTILYFGDTNSFSTSFHRANALERLGHKLILKDTEKQARTFPLFEFARPFHLRTGFRLIQKQLSAWIAEVVSSTAKPDLIWVNCGELLGPACLKILKNYGCPIVLYNNDDPTGPRDGHRFDSLKLAIPYYDLCVVMREINVPEFGKKGAKKTLRVYMSYDELTHQPIPETEEIPLQFRSEVAFIGSWMRNERRDDFLLELINQGVPVSIWGERWHKSPHWKTLKSVHKGDALSGKDYVAAIQGSKICLGMLSKGNRDLHTQRSLEVPYAGGLLCAERTAEHVSMYKEGEEAFFWKDAKECAELCKRLLKDEELMQNVRHAGMLKVRSSHRGNQQICELVLNELHTDYEHHLFL